MNPADKAQVAQAEFAAQMARRDAGLITENTRQAAQDFTQQAESVLSQGVAVLGKFGNLGFERSKEPGSTVDVGETVTTQDLVKHSGVQRKAESRAEVDQAVAAYESAQKVERDLGGIEEIETPGSVLYSSGSDLLTMTSLRDRMERDKRRLVRQGAHDAFSALLAGENYEQQSEYADRAATYNMFSNILRTGVNVASWFKGGGG